MFSFHGSILKLLYETNWRHNHCNKFIFQVFVTKKHLNELKDTHPTCLTQKDDCDGIVLEILMDRKFQWQQEELNCEPLIGRRLRKLFSN